MSTQHPPVTVPDTEMRMLSSSHSDQEYQISVALPPGYADSKYDNLKLITRVFDGEAHISVMPYNLSRGIRAVFCVETHEQ